MNPEAVKVARDTDGAAQVMEPELAAIVARLRRLIVEDLDVRIPEEQVTDDVLLLEGGLGLDSIALFELISLIEKSFGFEFSDQALHTEVFQNLKVLARHVRDAMPSRKQAV
jgi:acyl carrier protein